MPRSFLAAVLLGAAALAACSPTFNWREVRLEPTALHAMLPCKPDKAERRVPLAGKEVALEVLGCETGDATFAILHADLGQPGLAPDALAQWRTAADTNLRATASGASPFRPAGALALPQSLQVHASGQRANGTAVEGRSAYFAHGNHVFQAVIYADRIQPEFADPFFTGLRFP